MWLSALYTRVPGKLGGIGHGLQLLSLLVIRIAQGHRMCSVWTERGSAYHVRQPVPCRVAMTHVWCI